MFISWTSLYRSFCLLYVFFVFFAYKLSLFSVVACGHCGWMNCISLPVVVMQSSCFKGNSYGNVTDTMIIFLWCMSARIKTFGDTVPPPYIFGTQVLLLQAVTLTALFFHRYIVICNNVNVGNNYFF